MLASSRGLVEKRSAKVILLSTLESRHDMGRDRQYSKEYSCDKKMPFSGCTLASVNTYVSAPPNQRRSSMILTRQLKKLRRSNPKTTIKHARCTARIAKLPADIDFHLALTRWASPSTTLKSTVQARHGPVVVSYLGRNFGPQCWHGHGTIIGWHDAGTIICII